MSCPIRCTYCRTAASSSPATPGLPPSLSAAATARLPTASTATGRTRRDVMSAVLDFPVKPEARDYLARFARDADEPGWLAARRQQGMTRFAETGFPSRKNEGWRYLDLQPLERRPLLPVRVAVRPDAAAL